MRIPSFINLRSHIDPEERVALRLLLEAALKKQTAQVRGFDGEIHEGWLNLQMSPKLETFFGALLDRIK